MQQETLSTTRRRLLVGMGASLPLLGLAGNARAASQWFSSQQSQTSASSDPATRFLRRTGFEPRSEDIERFNSLGLNAYLEEQLDWQSLDEGPVASYIQNNLPVAVMADCSLFSQKAKLAEQQLSGARLFRAVWSNRQLYEKMVGFWTDHFNIHQPKSNSMRLYKVKDENEVIRPHALGSFRDMLHASARSPAMLAYLDNWQNVAWGPNENYARELMELHTLGVDGGYTENDVREVTRCLTGWSLSFGLDGWPCGGGTGFVFYPELHDPGTKNVLGTVIENNGIEDGNRVLDMLVAHPATARHLAGKLCRFFVGENASEQLITDTANAYGADGDIKAMLRVILSSDELLSSPDELYRRPFEYGVACLRSLELAVDEPWLMPIVGLLINAGHMPYQWPAPDGYPMDSAYWINSNGLLSRWKLAIDLAVVKGNDGQYIAARLAGEANTANAIVDRLSEQLLKQPLSDTQHQGLASYIAAGVGLDSPLSTHHQLFAAVYATALILSSADFQLY